MSDSNSSLPVGFRVIPGYLSYAINESGVVLSACGRGGGWRKPKPWGSAIRLAYIKDNGGYNRVSLNRNGRSKQIPVHTLVLLTFVGPRPDGMQCRHLDGNQCNNHVSNLSWGTPLENHFDKHLHGTDNRGEKCYKAKLKTADVLEIRERAASGEKLTNIARDFPVVLTGILKIVNRETWKHI